MADQRVAFGDAGTAVITTTQGLIDGKQQTYEEVISKGKNIGRVNETTPFERAMAEAQSKWDEKKNRKHYGTTVEESEIKREIAPVLAQVYKKNRDKVHWGEKNIFGQPKLNGNRCHGKRNKNSVLLTTRSGINFVGTPHLQDQLLSMMDDGETWDGGLYAHGMIVTSLNSLLRRHQPDSDKGMFSVYDMLSPKPFQERMASIERSLPSSRGSIELIETVPDDKVRYRNRNQIERFFGRIKQFRRVTTRYEKTLQNFAGFIWLAVLMVNVL